MTSTPRFTVCTPTFNRAHTLARVYDSLAGQTLRDFEWLVIDDGSTDDTPGLLEHWARVAPFRMRYERQDNGGKHVAVQRAVAEARGGLFTILDSDDACVPEALERFVTHWDGIEEGRRDRFAGVVCRCMDPDGHVLGPPLPAPVLDASPLEVRYRYGIREELWGCTRTEILRRYPFPDSPRRTYVPESLVWDRISQRYLSRFVDQPWRVYHHDLQDSLASPRDPARFAAGGALQYAMVLNEHWPWARHAPLEMVRAAVHYGRFSLHGGVGLGAQGRALRHPAVRGLWLAALPLAYILVVRDRSRR